MKINQFNYFFFTSVQETFSNTEQKNLSATDTRLPAWKAGNYFWWATTAIAHGKLKAGHVWRNWCLHRAARESVTPVMLLLYLLPVHTTHQSLHKDSGPTDAALHPTHNFKRFSCQQPLLLTWTQAFRLPWPTRKTRGLILKQPEAERAELRPPEQGGDRTLSGCQDIATGTIQRAAPLRPRIHSEGRNGLSLAKEKKKKREKNPNPRRLHSQTGHSFPVQTGATRDKQSSKKRDRISHVWKRQAKRQGTERS